MAFSTPRKASDALDSQADEATQHKRKRARVSPGDSMHVANGSTSPGAKYSNGSAEVDEDTEVCLGSHSVSKVELIRLLEQALSSLGYDEVAARLEEDSGVQLQAPEVAAFQKAVLAGDWQRAEGLLDRLGLPSREQQLRARFMLLEQKFLELMEARDVKAALHCLRSELSPLGIERERLHQLAGTLLARSAAELRRAAQWAGPSGGSREQLLRNLQVFVPAGVMLPDGRLEALLGQALDAQLARCRYHNSRGVKLSLLTDYECGREQIPSVTTQVLLDHADEVWHLQFSHDGRRLASAGKDCTAIVWNVALPSAARRSTSPLSAASPSSSSPADGPRVTKHLVLRGHTKPIAFLAWSPDDRLLATCGNDHLLKLWMASTGACVRTLAAHQGPVTAVAWLPDGARLVTGGHDKQILLHDTEGKLVRSWRAQRINDLAVTPDGRRLLSISSERKVRITSLDGAGDGAAQAGGGEGEGEGGAPGGEGACLAEADSIISMSLAADGRALLLNLANQRIHAWALPPDPAAPLPAAPAHSYAGPAEKAGRYVVRSCFGGYNQSFVLSGSEECRVYVWHRASGELLAALEGHSGTVNAVAWNPVDHHMFASASDDKSIHIWGLAAEAQPGDSAGSRCNL